MAAQAVGALGEAIIKDFNERCGLEVVLSDDPFDAEKDMTIDGVTVEVKTQLLIEVDDAFWLDIGQLKKVDAVGRLFFNQIPRRKSDPIVVWESRRDLIGSTFRRRYFTKDDGRGNMVIVFPRKYLTRVLVIDDEGLREQMRDLCSSSYLENDTLTLLSERSTIEL
jgi:hypothetical protein